LALTLAGCSFRIGAVSKPPPPSSPSPGVDDDMAEATAGASDLATPIAIGFDAGAPDLATPPILPPPPADMAQPIVQPVLTVSIAPSTETPVDQTAGTIDWAHWGLKDESSFDHKSGGVIGNFINLQTSTVRQFDSYPIGFSWTGGTPTATATNTTTGVYVKGTGAGFRLVIPADTTLHTLKLYGGGQKSKVQMTAQLSDGSAPTAMQETSDFNGLFQRVATVTFRAATPCQLQLDWQAESTNGFVHVQSVTLQ
jgi:hypothetical protein